MCYVHSAALIAEYLKVRDLYPGGCGLFKNISPNILPDETIVNDVSADAGEVIYTTVIITITQFQYFWKIQSETLSLNNKSLFEILSSQKHLLDLLEISVDRIKLSERYEMMGEVYRIAIPLYEMTRNFQVRFVFPFLYN